MLLAMYAADLLEEQLIACMVKNASPATTIILAQFRDFCPHKPYHRKDTLAKIKALCKAVHPWDITTFQKQVKVVNLLGVHLPYWWDPTYFLVSSSSTLVTKFLMIIQWRGAKRLLVPMYWMSTTKHNTAVLIYPTFPMESPISSKWPGVSTMSFNRQLYLWLPMPMPLSCHSLSTVFVHWLSSSTGHGMINGDPGSFFFSLPFYLCLFLLTCTLRSY